ncbi:MAG: hypothetical protein IT290_07520, partial [Deltaproteobacteria bacterium]|nr:hypothetical protein [Deltaproteobacteria bacterium]
SFPPSSPFAIYSNVAWHSEAWDARDYGRDFDPSRPFFEQFAELQRAVPRPALFVDHHRDVNSEYTNYAGLNKNCYLLFQSGINDGCLYGYFYEDCRDCADCCVVHRSELCAELIESERCYTSAYLEQCENCTESYFLDNCIGCRSCILCVNLRHKTHHIFNQPVSAEVYEEFRQKLQTAAGISELSQQFEEFRQQFPIRASRTVRCEESSGHSLVDCVRAVECFDCRGLEDGRYAVHSFPPARDVVDCYACGQCELIYECQNVGIGAYDVKFSSHCVSNVRELTYCDQCWHSSELFGCVGIRGGKHCILNRQYSEVEYHEKVSEIVEHMKRTGEWGEFFPMKDAPIPYNLSLAQDYFPLSRDAALAQGLSWYEDDTPSVGGGEAPPSSLNSLTPDIHLSTLQCNECGKGFRYTERELVIRRQLGIAPAGDCFFCRHRRRLQKRAPRALFERQCEDCGVAVLSPYAADFPRAIICDECPLPDSATDLKGRTGPSP